MFRYPLIFLAFICFNCSAQQDIRLYKGAIPNAKITSNEEQWRANAEVDSLVSQVSIPTLTVFLPPKGKANGISVIICPGGGYHTLLIKREGTDVAKAFNKLGITAFVLKYRLPNEKTMQDKSIGPLQDAQQAIKLVRSNAKQWQIDPDKIGIMGYSAGGHLAASAGSHFDISLIPNEEKINLRPDFMILINPVISFKEKFGHVGSRNNLIGHLPEGGPEHREKELFFSNEKHVSKATPPTFINHAQDDSVVPVENTLSFYAALRANKVPSELHIYQKGEHGYLKVPAFTEWFNTCTYWLNNLF